MLALDLRPMSRLRLRERPAITSEWPATLSVLVGFQNQEASLSPGVRLTFQQSSLT
jgi:hypothetical protein